MTKVSDATLFETRSTQGSQNRQTVLVIEDAHSQEVRTLTISREPTQPHMIYIDYHGSSSNADNLSYYQSSQVGSWEVN